MCGLNKQQQNESFSRTRFRVSFYRETEIGGWFSEYLNLWALKNKKMKNTKKMCKGLVFGVLKGLYGIRGGHGLRWLDPIGIHSGA